MFENALEVFAPQYVQRRVLHRDDVRRAWFVVDQRHLAEELAFAEHGENDFAPVFADEDDLDLSFRDDIERVAGIVLEQDDGVLGVGTVAGDFHHPLQVCGGELAEQGNLLQHIGRRHANSLRRVCGGVN